MAKPWTTLATAQTEDGLLELRKRDERDFLILVDNRILMNSVANRSELALGALACRPLASKQGARVLVGGLGMGYTLHAALDALADDAEVVVAELNPVIADWCRGPLAAANGAAVTDPRVRLVIDDVARVIRVADGPFDAILLDLYEGPHTMHTDGDPLYGQAAVENARRALKPGGIFSVWGETVDQGFLRRLKRAGFRVDHQRPGKGGLRHVVYLAKR